MACEGRAGGGAEHRSQEGHSDGWRVSLWNRGGRDAVSQSDSLCQAEPGSIWWVTSFHSQRCRLPSSCPCTNTGQMKTWWHSLGPTAALEVPQECTEFKSYVFSIPAPCHIRLPGVLERQRSHRSFSLHPPPSSLVLMLRATRKCTVHPDCFTTV